MDFNTASSTNQGVIDYEAMTLDRTNSINAWTNSIRYKESNSAVSMLLMIQTITLVALTKMNCIVGAQMERSTWRFIYQ